MDENFDNLVLTSAVTDAIAEASTAVKILADRCLIDVDDALDAPQNDILQTVYAVPEIDDPNPGLYTCSSTFRPPSRFSVYADSEQHNIFGPDVLVLL